MGLLPAQDAGPVAVQLVALLEDQLRDAFWPTVMLPGDRPIDTVGAGVAGAFTVTVVELEPDPPGPVQLSP